MLDEFSINIYQINRENCAGYFREVFFYPEEWRVPYIHAPIPRTPLPHSPLSPQSITLASSLRIGHFPISWFMNFLLLEKVPRWNAGP